MTHTIRKENRQAEAALKQLADEHPDYLFTRVALSTKALDKDQLEKAPAQLGPTLDIRNLYPQRSPRGLTAALENLPDSLLA